MLTRAATLALLLCLACPARADEPLPPRVPMRAGDVAKFDGVLLSLPETARIVTACRESAEERDRLRAILAEKPPEPTPTGYLVAGGLGVLVGFAVGVWAVTR